MKGRVYDHKLEQMRTVQLAVIIPSEVEGRDKEIYYDGEGKGDKAQWIEEPNRFHLRALEYEPGRFEKYPYEFFPGQKVKFKSEKQRYTVRVASKRYAICTKPFNAQKTVLYCIIDQWLDIRGPENLVFGMGAETDEQCLEMLVRLLDGESEVSHRHQLKLDIERVE